MLKRVKLKDYCCHRTLDAQFEAGINCIIGTNGAGKSSLVSALYGGLTNSYDHPDGMKGVIRQGAETAKIEIETDDFTLVREIGEKNKHLLIIGDETFRAAKDIENILITRYNLVKAILDKFVFIRQGKFTDVIGLSDADRAKTLAYLSNVEYFESLWKRLADEIKLHETVLTSGPSFDENSLLVQIEELNKAIAELVANETAVKDKLTAVNAEGNWSADLDALNHLKTSQMLVTQYQADLSRLAGQMDTAQGAVFKAEAEYKAISDKVTKIELTDKELQDVQLFQEYLVKYPMLAKLQQELAALEADLANYNKEQLLSDNAKLVAQLTAQNERLTKLKMQLRVSQNASKNLVCEVCGAPPEAQFKGNPTVITNTITALVENTGQLEKAIAANNTTLTHNDMKQARIVELRQQINSTQLPQITDNRKYYDELLVKYQTYTGLLPQEDKARIHFENTRIQQQTILEQYGSVEYQLKQSQAMAAKAPEIEKKAAKAQQKINEINELKLAQSTNNVMRTEKQTHLNSLKDLLKQVQQKKNQKKLQKYVDLLTEVRALTHRNNIPHIISKRFLNQLTGNINSYLEQFEAPFKVLVGKDLGFIACMDSGANVPATILSGGQKAMLALSFWLSVFQASAGDTGFMVIDEGGDGLDADNRQLFNQVLTKIDRIFKGQGKQLIVITHDNTLIGQFYTISL